MDHPFKENYYAFYLALIWYREITPEESFRILSGQSTMKPGCRNITPGMVEAMDRITASKHFKSWSKLEYQMKVNRYTIQELVRKRRIQKLCETLQKIKVKKEYGIMELRALKQMSIFDL